MDRNLEPALKKPLRLCLSNGASPHQESDYSAPLEAQGISLLKINLSDWTGVFSEDKDSQTTELSDVRR